MVYKAQEIVIHMPSHFGYQSTDVFQDTLLCKLYHILSCNIEIDVCSI